MNNTNWSTLSTAFTAIVTLITAGVVFGEMRGKLERNSEDIKQMQNDNRKISDQLTDIRLDVKEIRSKFDILVPTPTVARREP